MTTSENTVALEILETTIKKMRAARLKLSQGIKDLEAIRSILSPTDSTEAIAEKNSPSLAGGKLENLAVKTPKDPPAMGKPKPSDHPAIQTYRDVFHTYPQKGMYQQIVEQVGDNKADLIIWRDCCTTWCGNGWNPKNIAGQLERFSQEWMDAGPGDFHEEVIDGVRYNVYADGTRELATLTD